MERTTMKKALTNRNIQMIALGGAIGTGLFLGSAKAIRLAGPAVLLTYFLSIGRIGYVGWQQG